MKSSFKLGFILFFIGDLILLFNLNVQEWLPKPVNAFSLMILVFAIGVLVDLSGILMMRKHRH
ncbi:hypothetical protein Hs30E_08590 [Lactococcus hodotermopsidis]|uniref:Uncharacterized protein n=1 Tax=Pseudolactococcus hodotermopsidis TaxID=2709157 RepID=A0A6A0BD79_9LACT|nr:hypothetical protein [Lactococcus hodotermopsidis]GFH42308.1 hypothetical protein Hs30E_08590 [Lactococcus hodotermopsidis]